MYADRPYVSPEYYPFLELVIPKKKYGFYWHYIDSGYLFYIIAYLILAELVVLFWWFLFKFEYLPEWIPQSSSAAFSIMSIFIGLIFLQWITNAENRFAERVKYYNACMQTSNDLGCCIAGCVECVEEVCCEQVELMDQLRLLCCTLCLSMTQCFLSDKGSMNNPFRHKLDHLQLPQELKAELQRYVVSASSDAGGHSITMTETQNTDALIQMIRRRVSSKRMPCTKQQVLHNLGCIDRVSDNFGMVKTHGILKAYQPYAAWQAFAVKAYFGFLPLVLWAAYKEWTFIIYPIVVYLFTGAAVVAKWLGDPFEGRSLYRRINWEEIYACSALSIYKAFDLCCPTHTGRYANLNYGL